MNIIDAMINSTKGVTSNDRFDDEFRKVNFPFIPTYHYHHGSRLLLHLLCYRFLCCFLLLLFHSPFPAEMSPQLFVYALQVYLVRPNKPNSFSITTPHPPPGRLAICWHRYNIMLLANFSNYLFFFNPSKSE